MWSLITWGFTGQEWRRKQKDEDWVTVERFRGAQASFIHHPQSVSLSILLFIMHGKMLCLCWWFFSFRPVSQSIKAVPFWPDAPVTSDVFRFIEPFWNANPIPTPPHDEQVFSKAFGGQRVTGEIMTQNFALIQKRDHGVFENILPLLLWIRENTLPAENLSLGCFVWCKSELTSVAIPRRRNSPLSKQNRSV